MELDTERNWTQKELDRKNWTQKELDTEGIGHRKNWTQKELDTEGIGHRKKTKGFSLGRMLTNK